MYYELRTYTAAPGKLADLQTRFREHTIHIFARHYMTVVGFWTPDEPGNDKLVYLMSYPDRESCDASWAAFRNDPEWKEAKAQSEVNGILAAHIENQYLTPTDFSPLK